MFFPFLAFAQEAEIYEPTILEKTWWVIIDFIAWPTLCLIIIALASWILLIPIKKRIKRFKLVHVSVVISLFCIWYFYPCINYKGTYIAEYTWLDSKEESAVIIDDQFLMFDGDYVGSYHINPFQRMLWVEKPLFLNSEYPVKLRWNKIIIPMFKIGWVEHNKTKANQQVDPIVKTPVD